MRWLIRIVIILAIAVVLIPYAIAPFYRVIDPVSMPMLWRWATGKRFHSIVVTHNRISIREAMQQADESGEARGASTITQQTAKNLFLWEGRSFIRKGLEFPLALWLNLVLPKRRVLEIYLNIAEWGPTGEFGAEAGARWAFGKSARDVNSSEAAILAAVLPNPVQRSARTPGVLLRRLAGLYERRSIQFSGLDACVRGP